MRDKLLLKLKKHDEKALEAVIEQYSRLVATVINNISRGSLTKEDIGKLLQMCLLHFGIMRIKCKRAG